MAVYTFKAPLIYMNCCEKSWTVVSESLSVNNHKK